MIYRDHLQIIDCLINKQFIKEFGYPILPNKQFLNNDCEYYGYFTKGLIHNASGDLIDENDYVKMMKYIMENNRDKFSKLIMKGKMVDPFASDSAVVNGVMQGSLRLIVPPQLDSIEASNEMIELYSQAISRDIPFIEYSTNVTIGNIATLLNKNINQLFKANLPVAYFGPYISQFLLLNVDFDTYKIVQKYSMYLNKSECIKLGIRNEWGVTLNEAVNIQNIELAKNPPAYPDKFLVEKFIYDGRTLARAVHKDTPYQYFYNAYMILSKLKIPVNPTWPQINNNAYFLMATGTASILCSIAEVTKLSLFHAWYWKWQQYRKLRPEEFAIMIDNVKNSTSPHPNKYGINEKILNSSILEQIAEYNKEWTSIDNQYVMPLTYVEGSPLHPAYPSGHAIISGATVTLLKMMFDGNAKWLNYNQVYQASATGESLELYQGTDINDIIVQTELDKLASNVAYGRNWAGIHYRSDANEGIYLGEKVAVEYMRDLMARNNFTNSIKFRGFNGVEIEVKPLLC